MSTRDGEPRGAMLLTSLLALLLHTIPLPPILNAIRPAFVVLAVIYWSLTAPRAGGIALGFLGGLALDVFKGAVLGQYALASSLIAYISIRQHLLIRNKPVFEQSLIVAILLLVWELVVWAIDGWKGHNAPGLLRWLHIVTGTMIWPLLALGLRRTHAAR